MFESIIIRKLPNQDEGIDAGLLAEALLFYNSVHLLLDHGSLVRLLKTIGPDAILHLIEGGYMKATYFRNSFGTHTNRDSGVPVYDFIAYEFAGTQEKGVFKNKKEKILHIFERTLGAGHDTNKAAKGFLQRVPIRKFCPGFEASGSITNLARQDLDDIEYVENVVEIVLRNLVPGIELEVHGFRSIQT